MDEQVENVFFESKNLKLKKTDKYIYYSGGPLIDPPPSISQISSITMHDNLLQTNYTIAFEVFIPEKGRWGTVDRPGMSFSSQKEAYAFIGMLEKAIAWGQFRLMYENIENYY